MTIKMGTFEPPPDKGGLGFSIGGLLLATTLQPIAGNGSITPIAEIIDEADFQIRVTRIALAFVTIALIVVAIGGNVIVISAILNTPYLRRLNNYLIVSLSLADLGTAVFCMPFFVMELFYNYGWPLSHVLCGLYAAIEISFGLLSVFTLGAISCERVFLITKPMVYQRIVTEVRLIIFIVFLWVVCFSYGFLQILWFYTDSYYEWAIHNPNKCRYLPSREFTIFAFMIAFVLPLGIMTGAYMKIFCVVRGQIQRIRPRLQSCTEDGLSEEFSTFHMDKARSDRNQSIGGIPEHRSLENVFESKSIKETSSEPMVITDELAREIGVGQDALEVITPKVCTEIPKNSHSAVPEDKTISQSQNTKTLNTEGDGNLENTNGEVIETVAVECNRNSPNCNPTRPNSHSSHTSSGNIGTNGNEPGGLDFETKVSRHNNDPKAVEDLAHTESQMIQTQLGASVTESEKPLVESAAGVTIRVESPREDIGPINLVSGKLQASERSLSSGGSVSDNNGITQGQPDGDTEVNVNLQSQSDNDIKAVPADGLYDQNKSDQMEEEGVFLTKLPASSEKNSKDHGTQEICQPKQDQIPICGLQTEKDCDNCKELNSDNLENRNESLQDQKSAVNSQTANEVHVHSNTEENTHVQKTTHTPENQSRSSSKCSILKKIMKSSSLSSLTLNKGETVLQIAVSPADPSHSTSWDDNKDNLSRENVQRECVESSNSAVSKVDLEHEAQLPDKGGDGQLEVAFPESRVRSSSCNEAIQPSNQLSGLGSNNNQVSVPLRRVSSACELPILDKLQGSKPEPLRLHSVLKKPTGPKGLENYPLHQKRNSVQFKLYDDAVLEPGVASDQGLRAVLVDDETTGSSEGNTTETSLSSTHPLQKVIARHRNNIDDTDGDNSSLAHTPSHRHTLQWARRHFNSIDSAFMTSTASMSQYSHSIAMSEGGTMSRRSSRRRSRLFENKAVRMTSYVIGAFVICWVPYQICMMLRLFAPKLVPDILWNVTTVIMFTSTAINPFIYNFYSSQFRAATRKLLKCQRNVIHPE